ncbi:MAG: D-tyrosyl-tRNA(Tyr) deacylase [Verrucomicrobia bacterium]|nr:D-tyrosyl-tRNA(Tyr) deacylase [Verrucomicrobiota bacterium]MBS0635917.1 D-tyrosyl-tRNA(Tyr) deacylase [Verrucomicrobiota bacterium]
MRAVIQRVAKAKVTVEDEIVGKIDAGLLVLLGIQHSDSDKETKWLVDKIVNLRIFADDDGKMNLSVKDLGLGLLVISQFTLYGNCLSGRRPDFIQAARPEHAMPLYEDFIKKMNAALGYSVQTGRFGAKMQVELINDGPVTFFLEH